MLGRILRLDESGILGLGTSRVGEHGGRVATADKDGGDGQTE